MSWENLQLLSIDLLTVWRCRRERGWECESVRGVCVYVCAYIELCCSICSSLQWSFFSFAFGIESVLIALRPSTCSSRSGICWVRRADVNFLNLHEKCMNTCFWMGGQVLQVGGQILAFVFYCCLNRIWLLNFSETLVLHDYLIRLCAVLFSTLVCTICFHI